MATLNNLPQVDIVKKFKNAPWIGFRKIGLDDVIELKLVKRQIFLYKLHYVYTDNSYYIFEIISDLQSLKKILKEYYRPESKFEYLKKQKNKILKILKLPF